MGKTNLDELELSGALTVAGAATLGSVAVTGAASITGAASVGGLKLPVELGAANGAIASTSGVVMLTKAGVAAMTLAAPTAGTDDGKVLHIVAATANAHTVTHTAGFGAGGALLDVATFGGAVGDNMTIVAYGGKWYVLNLLNVTLG